MPRKAAAVSARFIPSDMRETGRQSCWIRERKRQTDIQTELLDSRETDRKTERWSVRFETDRQKDREMEC